MKSPAPARETGRAAEREIRWADGAYGKIPDPANVYSLEARMRNTNKSTRPTRPAKPSRPARGQRLSPEHASRDSRTGKLVRDIVVRYGDTFRELSKK